MSALPNAFGDTGCVIPRSLMHVRNHFGNGVVVVDDVDTGLSPVPPVHLPLPLEHQVEVYREAVAAVNVIVVVVVGVIAICCRKQAAHYEVE